ncbi:uncharacterized protein LOC124291069 [Haliotis rubra]|uniref:uncharacterized protein LOC124291069 n=1 Tax=Haliotis rubra TaxID=36100 RepID=UPI001EE5BF05|nr:uncharacterized protein LOC124291069 [Haliotis rubra]
MGNSASTLIGNQTTICLNVQTSAAEKLQSLSELIRKQQKDANIAKATCASAGAIGGGMVLLGAASGLVTGGISLVLMGAGAAAGLAGGAGEMAVSWLESEEMTKRIAEVQSILDQLRKETQGLIAALRRKSKYRDVPDYDTLLENKTKLDCAKKCGRRARKAISVVSMTLQVQWMATGLKPEEVGVHNIAKFRRGLSFLGKVKAGKVIKSAGVAAAGISLAFDVKDVLKSLNDVKNNVSEVADVVANMANVLGVTE